MDGDDPEMRIAELERQLAAQKRIAELERQIAEAKAAAGQGCPEGRPPRFSGTHAGAGEEADQRARQYAEALWEGMRSGAPAGPGGPSQPEMAQHRQAFMRAAAEAGLSPAQIDDIFENGIFKNGEATIKVGHSVAYSGPVDPPEYSASAAVEDRPGTSWAAAPRWHRIGGQPPRGRMRGADLVGAILGFIGICAGGAAALTAAMPSSALWMSSIVCSGGYHLAYGTSGYSYRPGQSGTRISFECVGDTDSYSPSWLAIDAFQSLLFLLVVGTAVVVGRMVWRRLRTS
jgi:hypothetical protein